MNIQALAMHILAALAIAQIDGRRLDLETLTDDLRVRRGDIRKAVSALHREGYLDALRMRPTLLGFALGRRYAAAPLPALREPPVMVFVAAA